MQEQTCVGVRLGPGIGDIIRAPRKQGTPSDGCICFCDTLLPRKPPGTCAEAPLVESIAKAVLSCGQAFRALSCCRAQVCGGRCGASVCLSWLVSVVCLSAARWM